MDSELRACVVKNSFSKAKVKTMNILLAVLLAITYWSVTSVTQAAAAGARLIVLTEMFATGFSMQPERIAEHPGGANEQFLVDQAREHGSWLVGSTRRSRPWPASKALATAACPCRR